MKNLVLAALCLATLHCRSSATDQSLQAVKAKGSLVLGLDDSFPPMGFRNEDNQIVGYDIDLAKEVARRLGVRLVAQPIDWNAKEQELATGKIDCIWNGFTITGEREKAMAFTKPYLRNAQVVVVKKDSPYTTLASLKGRKVGLQAGSSAATALEGATAFRASLAQVVEFKDNLTALMDLEAHGVDAVVMDLIVANDNIKRSGRPYVVLQESLAPEVFGVGFRKHDLALRDAVQGALQAMAADGTLAKITAGWFGSDLSVVGK
ncbi:amino acid ABC transporter substrate-binding protein [Anaeromyxobacter oryzisoli]|uniref:amino acid ABC transporter substrate-binding protein n=1 Tax=Anaeromyxobacter oryzisoli TaxID=2925408 RepID=UPI001F58C174|nr:amino acid ABC transporter substrate-binding protein [Anaeromyxobacter sp. SG63]